MTALLAVSESGLASSSFVLVYVVGFLAAVTIGSIAWYNSKRPPGWEDKEKPDFVPSVEADRGEEV